MNALTDPECRLSQPPLRRRRRSRLEVRGCQERGNVAYFLHAGRPRVAHRRRPGKADVFLRDAMGQRNLADDAAEKQTPTRCEFFRKVSEGITFTVMAN